MKYDKLVRDKVPTIIEQSGKKAITRTLNDDEYKIYLEKKLVEEVAEFQESKSMEELADILEVIYSLADSYNSVTELVETWGHKAIDRGSFKEKILLLEVLE